MSVSTVSATIQDPSGQIFANGTWSLEFVPTYGVPGVFTDGGVPFTRLYGGNLDNTGSFSQANVNRSDTINPAGSLWRLTVTPNANDNTFQVLLNINSPAFNASAAINAIISNISITATPVAHAYKDSEVFAPPTSGAMYYDVVNKVVKLWDVATQSWVATATSGGAVLTNPLGNQTITQPGGTKLTVTGETDLQLGAVERAASAGLVGSDKLWPDSTQHRWLMNNNNSGAQQIVGLGIGGVQTLNKLSKYNAVKDLVDSSLTDDGTNVTISLPITGNAKKLNGVRFADQFAGADIFAQIVAAITDLGGPGIIDASNCTSLTPAGSLTIAQTEITILFPIAPMTLGANQIIVNAGVNNVSLLWPIQKFFNRSTYTGTGAAIQVGTSAADTLGFYAENCPFDISGAGNAASGIQLNRCIAYILNGPSISAKAGASSQHNIELLGFTNFTGGTILNPQLINGDSEIFFGKNANTNDVFGGIYSTGASSKALNFDGAGVTCDGNRVWGGDVEGATTAIRFDFAANNRVWMRFEGNTTAISATANSSLNKCEMTGQTGVNVTDLGTNNSFYGQPDFNINSSGIITTYRRLATDGNGVSSVQKVTGFKSETGADATLLSYTPPAVNGKYRVSFALDLSAANAATLGWSVAYENVTGNVKAPTNVAMYQLGVAAPALTFTTSTASDCFYGSVDITIDSTATAIVVKLTFAGTSFTGKASASIERII